MATEKTERANRMPKRKRSSRRSRRRRKRILASLSVILAAAVGVGIWMYQSQKQQADRHVTAGNSVDMKAGYRTITYKGKEYQYNSLITTILYAGIDSEGEMTVNEGYADAARADSTSVVVLDKKHKKMTIIALSRDTMTDVHRYSLSGRDRGAYETHLGFAYAYGEGGEVSCENLRLAVSDLLGGIPINEYAVTNQSSMTYINNLVGGVTVTVPNNDLAALHPELTEGMTVKLDDSNVRD